MRLTIEELAKGKTARVQRKPVGLNLEQALMADVRAIAKENHVRINTIVEAFLHAGLEQYAALKGKQRKGAKA